jgi:hypothetical protein
MDRTVARHCEEHLRQSNPYRSGSPGFAQSVISVFEQQSTGDLEIVIASAREAIHGAAKEKLDCFAASAPRNDVVSRYASAISRRIAPEACQKSVALK